MNLTIKNAIELDNLDLFRLVYNENITFDKSNTNIDNLIILSQYYFQKIEYYLVELLQIKINVTSLLELETNKNIITKDLISELNKIIKYCLIKDAKIIFSHIIDNILYKFKEKLFYCGMQLGDIKKLNKSKEKMIYFYLKAIYKNKCNIKDYINVDSVIWQMCHRINYGIAHGVNVFEYDSIKNIFNKMITNNLIEYDKLKKMIMALCFPKNSSLAKYTNSNYMIEIINALKN